MRLMIIILMSLKIASAFSWQLLNTLVDIRKCGIVIVEPTTKDIVAALHIKDKPLSSFTRVDEVEFSPHNCQAYLIFANEVNRPRIAAFLKRTYEKERSFMDEFVIICEEWNDVSQELDFWSNATQNLINVAVVNVGQNVSEIYSGTAFIDGVKHLELVNIWIPIYGLIGGTSIAARVEDLTDLNGHTFNVAYQLNDIYVNRQRINDNDDEDEDNFVFGGLDVDKFNVLANRLNFKMRMVRTVDGQYGSLDESSGEWNGMIGMIKRGDATWAFGAFVVSAVRHSAVDYGHVPIYQIHVGRAFFTTLPQPLPNWLSVVRPFPSLMWLLVLITSTVFIAVALAFFRAKSDSKSFNELAEWMLDMLTGNGINSGVRPAGSWSTWLLLVSWAFFATILSLAYTSLLIVSLTFPVTEPTLERFEELLNSDKFIIMPKDGTMQQLMQSATMESNPTYFKLWQKVLRQDPSITFRGFDVAKLRQTLLGNPDMAVMRPLAEISSFNIDEEGRKVLHQSSEVTHRYYISNTIQKKFVLTPLFNKYLQWMKDVGVDAKQISDVLLKKYGHDIDAVDLDASRTQDTLNLNHFLGPFAFLAIGMALAMLVFVVQDVLFVRKRQLLQ